VLAQPMVELLSGVEVATPGLLLAPNVPFHMSELRQHCVYYERNIFFFEGPC